MHYKDNTEVKPDNWRMDLPQLKELVGRDPVDVKVENKHVVCTFAGEPGRADTIVRFRKW